MLRAVSRSMGLEELTRTLTERRELSGEDIAFAAAALADPTGADEVKASSGPVERSTSSAPGETMLGDSTFRASLY
jgi:hypothetical protein